MPLLPASLLSKNMSRYVLSDPVHSHPEKAEKVASASRARYDYPRESNVERYFIEKEAFVRLGPLAAVTP